jgi:BlaI family penicillinase repressor
MRITEAEWEVMAVVWERTPVAATTVVEVLEKRKQWSLATVRTLLRRLVNKGALQQRIEGKRYIYTPLATREECVQRESESFLDRVLGRAPAASLLHLVRKADLSTKDIQELRRILREKEKKS